ncbi:MAG: LCP family protein [Anaerolineae bacterium]
MRRALFVLVGFLIILGLYLSGCAGVVSLPTNSGPSAQEAPASIAEPAEPAPEVAPPAASEPSVAAAVENANPAPAASNPAASSAAHTAPAPAAPAAAPATDKPAAAPAAGSAASAASAPPAGSKAASAAQANGASGGKTSAAAPPASAPAAASNATGDKPAAPASAPAAPNAAAPDAAAASSDGAPGEDAILKTVTVAPNAEPVPIAVTDLPGDDVTNILILGSDRRYKTDPGRTDVILLATIDKVHENIHLLSIPRDLWVYIPGVGYNRVNTAYLFGQLYKLPGGGIGTLKATLMHNLGLRVDRFVVADFNGFKKVVDDFGGVDVDVPCGLYDRNWVNLSAGRHHLDGEMALRYARTRYSTSDFSRAARQQQVLRALWEQTPRSELILKIPQLWATYKDSVDTDLNLGELLTLGQFLGRLHSEDIKTRVLTYPYLSPFTTSEGAAVLQLDQAGYRRMIADFYKGTPGAAPVGTKASADGGDVGRVVIWNGTNRPNLAELAAEALRNQGGLPVAGTGIAYTTDYPKTVILNYGAPPETISSLTKFFGIVPVQLVRQSESDMPDAVVVLGADYQTCRK